MAGSTQACTAVPGEVSSIFKARILEKHKQRELRRQEVVAQAAASRALSDAARGQQRKATVQRSMFDHVESTTRQDCDEKIAAFFYRCDLPFAAVDSAAFKDLVATLKTAPSGYKPPDRKRLSGDLLDSAEKKITIAKNQELEKARVYGAAIAGDGATVHGEPLANYVAAVATVKHPIHLLLLNAKQHIADGDCKDADYAAFGYIKAIEMTPDKGKHVVLVLADTAADEVLAAKMVETKHPQISYQPDPDHCCNSVLKLLCVSNE